MQSNFFRIALASTLLAGTSAAQAGRDVIEITFRADGKEISVRLDGDDTQVRIGGKDVTGKRAKVRGDNVTIQDPSGSPLAYVRRTGNGVTFARSPRIKGAAIGVQVGAIPPALAEHLDLEARDVIYVTAATKGRAAAKAGIRAHDVILEIDGESPVSERKLREILKAKSPGAKLDLTVLRRGKKRDVTVTCERASGSVYFPGSTTRGFGGFPHYGAQQKAYRDAMKALREVQKRSDESSRKKLEQAIKAFDRVQVGQQTIDFLPTLPTLEPFGRVDVALPPAVITWPERGDGKAKDKGGKRKGKGVGKPAGLPGLTDPERTRFSTPFVTPGLTMTGLGEQTPSLAKQLEKLEKRFDRLEEMLEKLVERKKIR